MMAPGALDTAAAASKHSLNFGDGGGAFGGTAGHAAGEHVLPAWALASRATQHAAIARVRARRRSGQGPAREGRMAMPPHR